MFSALSFGLFLSPVSLHAETLKLGDFSHWQWGSVVHEHDDGTITPCRAQYAHFASGTSNDGQSILFNTSGYDKLHSEYPDHDRDQVTRALRSYNPNLPDPHPIQNQDDEVCGSKARALS